MDLGKSFVSALLHEGKPAFKKLAQKGVKPQYLYGDGRYAFEFVMDYASQYGQIPTHEIVTGKTGISLPSPEGPADFFIEELINLQLQTRLQGGMQKWSSLLEDRKPREALELMEKMLFDIRTEKLGYSGATSMLQLGSDVLEFYEKMKAGERGIPFPWPSVTEATMGMWPGDLILFAARLGVGKTWTLLQVALAAWKAGARVLVATTEMTQERMAQRFHAMNLQLPYSDFRRGQLQPFIEKKMYDAIAELMSKDDGRLQVIGGDFDFQIGNLAAAIHETLPDLVILDGAYLVQSEGANRNEQAANAFNSLKRLAQTAKVPFAVTSQFNRDVKKNSPNSVQAENIGLTDVAGWNADAAFGLVQTEDMARDKRMIIKPLKVREGKGEEVECEWDIENMRFKELPKNAMPGDADPFAPGGPSSTGGGPLLSYGKPNEEVPF